MDREQFLVGSSYCLPGLAMRRTAIRNTTRSSCSSNGTGIQTIGEEKYEVRDNDMVYIPAGIPHSIENLSYQPLKMVIVKVNKGKAAQSN